MIKPEELRLKIRACLQDMTDKLGKDFTGQNVEDLLLMIACHESHLGKWTQQQGEGDIAKGIFQIEPETENDVYHNYLTYREPFLEYMVGFRDPDALENCLDYQIRLARFILWRKPEAIPELQDFSHSADPRGAYLANLAIYAKTHWNTPEGKATPQKYLDDFLRLTT